ncbi:hypothetical protein JZ751_024686 [Albula glossodonta]|uniref:Tetraspanin n=1 Tax=Albula glossodonta TaxID=121402 RepID=A0A8T2PMD8_9TELE|nr:hypothetical protein JZ751_024686 [Albula glossodonta]
MCCYEKKTYPSNMENGKKYYKMIKYTLFVCCYFFWVASAVLIAVGIYAKIAKEGGVVDSLTADPALLLIIIGSLMFIITFFGCCGALRNHVMLLKLVLQRTELLMRKGITRYREDMDLENLIDFVQKKFQCCGVHSYMDWSDNQYFVCSGTNPSLEACGVPFSCCIRHRNETVLNTMCGYEVQGLEKPYAEKTIYIAGCLEKIVRWGKQNLLLVGGMAVGLLGLEMLMICLAGTQMSRINRKTRRTY